MTMIAVVLQRDQDTGETYARKAFHDREDARQFINETGGPDHGMRINMVSLGEYPGE